MEPDSIPARGSRLRRSIVKREAPYVIYPEILVIVDYDGYRYVTRERPAPRHCKRLAREFPG